MYANGILFNIDSPHVGYTFTFTSHPFFHVNGHEHRARKLTHIHTHTPRAHVSDNDKYISMQFSVFNFQCRIAATANQGDRGNRERERASEQVTGSRRRDNKIGTNICRVCNDFVWDSSSLPSNHVPMA